MAALAAAPLTCGRPPYIANVITSESLEWIGGPDNGPKLARLVFGCLRPYGGTAALSIPGDGSAAFLKQVTGMKLPGARTSMSDGLAVVRREGALPGAADWTHEYGDPSNSLMSQDQLVRAPLGVLLSLIHI